MEMLSNLERCFSAAGTKERDCYHHLEPQLHTRNNNRVDPTCRSSTLGRSRHCYFVKGGDWWKWRNILTSSFFSLFNLLFLTSINQNTFKVARGKTNKKFKKKIAFREESFPLLRRPGHDSERKQANDRKMGI